MADTGILPRHRLLVTACNGYEMPESGDVISECVSHTRTTSLCGGRARVALQARWFTGWS